MKNDTSTNGNLCFISPDCYSLSLGNCKQMNIANLPTIEQLSASMNEESHYYPAEIADRIKRVKAVLQPVMTMPRDRVAIVVGRMDRSRKGWRLLDYMGLARISAIWQSWGTAGVEAINKRGKTEKTCADFTRTNQLGWVLEEYIGGVPRIGLEFLKVYDVLIEFTLDFLDSGKRDSLDWFQDVQIEYDRMDIDRLVVTITNSNGWVWDVDVEIAKAVILSVCGLSHDGGSTYLHKPIPMWIGQFSLAQRLKKTRRKR